MRRTGLSLIIFILFWWGAALLVDRPFLPTPPSVMVETVHQLLEGELLRHLGVSLFRILTAIVSAFLPALVLGITAGINSKADRMITPMVYLLFPIPKVALLPIILLFLGLGNLSKIFLVALILFFQFYLSIRDETGKINRRYYDSLFSLGGRKRDLFGHVILPAILPRIFSTLRLTLGTSIAVLFLAETFATRAGIGYFIMDSWSRIAYDRMYAGIFALSLMGLILFLLVELLERRFCRWIPRRDIGA